jgi:hypothetical protein
MLTTVSIAAFGVIASALAVGLTLKLVPLRQRYSPSQVDPGLAGLIKETNWADLNALITQITGETSDETKKLSGEVEALRELVLKLRYELAEAEERSARRELAPRQNPRTRDLELRRRREKREASNPEGSLVSLR